MENYLKNHFKLSIHSLRTFQTNRRSSIKAFRNNFNRKIITIKLRFKVDLSKNGT